jgi:hypothetical protein
MKKILFATAVAALASIAFADRQAFQEKFLTATGGKITKPGSQNGTIVIANAQTDVNVEWLKEAALYISDTLHYKATVESVTFNMQNANRAGSVMIYIVDDTTLPTIFCAPEEMWGVVNVAKIKSDKTAFYQARVKKEISRVFALVCGASSSKFVGTLLNPITSVSDLDTHIDNRLPADVIARIPPYLQQVGITPAFISTYIAACKQGWAPAPTNEYQKVIWDKVHEMPTEPIKIKPETKKQDK